MVQMSEAKGISLALATAVVSGASIFLNKFAVSGLNPFVFTTLKNVLVAVFLLSIIFLLKEFKNLKALSKKQWSQLALIGLVGGSIPFLLFFFALKLTSAVNAGFIHKTLFVWTLVFAVFFLKEKISKKFLAGAGLLFLGNILLFSNFAQIGFADLLILGATLLWAAENVFSKHVLKELYGRTVAFGRMFFGSIFMLVFLLATGQLTEIAAISLDGFFWVLVTSGFLFLYVFFYYTGLKYVRASIAAALLMLAQPITALLSFAFLGQAITPLQALAFLLMIAGGAIIIGTGYFLTIKEKAISFVLKKA